jgi:putative ABC transport system permease protein
MDRVLREIRIAFRTVRRMRGLAVAAILTLSLGIGATTTMFSVVDAALLRPVPFADPDRLVILYSTRLTQRDGLQRLRWSYPHFAEVRDSVTAFEFVASFSLSIGLAMTDHGFAEQIEGEVVAPAYFPLLRITPIAGRTFRPDEQSVAGAHPVVIISERLWRRRLNADPSIVNQTIRVNDVPLTVVGIVPADFTGLSGKASLWIPTSMAPVLTYSEYLTTPQHFLPVVGRLKSGVTLEQANAELGALGARIADSGSPASTVWGAVAVPMGEARIDPALQRSILLLFAAAACVLLIACVNIASLLLARARTRRREMAIRLAIGSSRRHLVQQLLAEGLILAGLAGVGGTALTLWGVRLYASTAPAVIPTARNDYAGLSAFATPDLDVRVVLFAIAVTVATTVLCALAPALWTSRAQPAASLKDDDRAGDRSRALGGFVVIEVALAVLLLTSAGLLAGSFAQIQRLRTGYVPDSVLTFWVRPPNSRYAPADGPAILERLLTRIQAEPAVESAALNRCAPFAGCSRTTLYFPDRPNDSQRLPVVGRHYISADYFTALGIPLRAGRFLTPADRAGRPPVTVVNATAARRFWPGEDPIGKRVWFGSGTGLMDPQRPVEVVGVVGDVKYESVDQPIGSDFYTSYLQYAFPDTMFIVKARAGSTDLLPALRSAVASVDPTVPIYNVMTLDDRIGGAVARPRFNAVLVASGAGAALLLAALGVYGVLSYSVSVRRREMGIRLALGADRRRVLQLVLGEGLRLAALGAVLGLAVAVGVSRLLRGFVVDAAAVDPVLLGLVAMLMMSVAAAAAFFPAARASAVDPVVALRTE